MWKKFGVNYQYEHFDCEDYYTSRFLWWTSYYISNHLTFDPLILSGEFLTLKILVKGKKYPPSIDTKNTSYSILTTPTADMDLETCKQAVPFLSD